MVFAAALLASGALSSPVASFPALSSHSGRAIASADGAGSTITVTSGWGYTGLSSGPSQIRADAVVNAIVTGSWKGGASAGWTPIKADTKGHFGGRYVEGGWIDAPVTVPKDGAYLLDARGDSYVFVNGVPRVGDVYESGYAKLPVWLHQGSNDLLFRCGRGDLTVAVTPAPKPVSLSEADPTLPDLHPGQRGKVWGAILICNASQEVENRLSYKVHQGGRTTTTAVRSLLPMSLNKAGFKIDAGGSPHLVVELDRNGKKVDEVKIDLRVRKAGETYKETFISDIDGSVQYFAVNPAWSQRPGLGLALSLHGAGVEAIGQADAYSSKPWASIVAATNRRPFGCDWEDWGRLDALEVLKIARAELQPDPSRIYLVGHSMGGHGTILNGALYPGMFAAIAPSAGWISASTYAGRAAAAKTDAQKALALASYQDETRRYLNNYRAEGVFLLQGGADDNVPPREEETLAGLLGKFHHDFEFTLVPGMGHWWDKSPEPGADCIDLAALWDFLGRHALPSVDSVHDIDFSTSNPEVSATEYWATIEQQTVPLRLSRVVLQAEPFLRTISGETRNVRTITLNLAALHPGPQLTVVLDGQTLKLDSPKVADSVTLTRESGTWVVSTVDLAAEKNPHRTGPFRSAFQHRFVLVYGTHGSAAENEAVLNKVRYDAETWWYRVNGSMDIVADRDFVAADWKGRSLILYGNADINSVWGQIDPAGPITVQEGSASAFGKTVAGTSVSGLYWIPKPGDPAASVGFVGGTDVAGIKATWMLPYLQPMIGYPDWLLFDSACVDPSSPGSWMDAGYYTNDWKKADPKAGDGLPPVPLDDPNWPMPSSASSASGSSSK